MAEEGFFSATFIDYDNEAANMRFPTPVLTALNWATQATLRGDFLIALANMHVGVRRASRYGTREIVGTGPSADNSAQRELKMLVRYHDTVTSKVYTVEIPCPELDYLDPADRAHFNLEDVGFGAFVSAFEGFVLSPDLNAVSVDECTLVGRRL